MKSTTKAMVAMFSHYAAGVCVANIDNPYIWVPIAFTMGLTAKNVAEWIISNVDYDSGQKTPEVGYVTPSEGGHLVRAFSCNLRASATHLPAFRFWVFTMAALISLCSFLKQSRHSGLRLARRSRLKGSPCFLKANPQARHVTSTIARCQCRAVQSNE